MIQEMKSEMPQKATPSNGRSRKENILSFREGHVYMALKMVSTFDEVNKVYKDPIPRVTFLVDGKYVRMPTDRRLLRKLGEFMVSVSDLLEGVDIPENNLDLDRARREIDRIKGISS